MAIVPKLKIEKAKTAELIPYVNNAKKHPEWQIDQIVASIDQFGMNDPIAVWTNESGGLEIVEGHGRLMACKRLGITEVPVIRLDHLDDDGRKAYLLVHNQLTMNTGFDFDMLDSEIEELSNSFNFEDFGFLNISEMNIDKLFEDHEAGQSDNGKPKTIICPECGHEIEL